MLTGHQGGEVWGRVGMGGPIRLIIFPVLLGADPRPPMRLLERFTHASRTAPRV